MRATERTPGPRSTSGRGSRRRLVFGAALVAAVLLAFAGKLVDVQVVRAASLQDESAASRSIPKTVYGIRGDILDRDGVALATSVNRFDVSAVPAIAMKDDSWVVPPEEAAPRIAEVLGRDAGEILALITADPASQNVELARAIDSDQLQRLKDLDVSWLYFFVHPSRTYPSGAVAGNLIGFVGADNTGLEGLELSQESCLRETDGEVVYERGADGTPIPGSEVVGTEAADGDDVVLTIDRDLNYFTQQVLADRVQEVGGSWGTAVVMDTLTGELLAVADVPTVDPNDVDATVSSAPDALGSRAFQAPFEPGSTVKAITAAMLLDAGVATPTTEVVAPYRYTTPEGAALGDSQPHPDWNLTLTGVLKESSNTGLSQLGVRLTEQQRYDYFQRFGYGTPTEVGFGAESGGSLGWNAPDWDVQSSFTTMFGQGMSTTAVQLASSYQVLANGGVREPVSLVAGCRDADGVLHDAPEGEATRVVSEQAADETIAMLENVATKGWLRDAVAVPGYRVAIKSGTAQQADGEGGYSESYLVSVSGIAPADAPRFVVSVHIADPVKMNTSMAAAPVFQKVMAQALKQFAVLPSGSSSPDLPTNF